MKTTTRRTMVAAGAATVLLIGGAGVAAAGGGPNGGGQDWSGGGQAAAGQVRAGDQSGNPTGAGPMRYGKGQDNGTGAGPMAGRGTGQQGSGDCLTTAPAAELTEEQQATLIHMRQEEQLAHDLYVALADKWDNDTFTRIAASESRHMVAVQRLLDRYGLTVPAPEEGEKFADDGLQQLWDELLEKGMTSQDAALEVGRTVERADIADLEAALADGQPADIARVFENLLAASKHHLAAFGG